MNEETLQPGKFWKQKSTQGTKIKVPSSPHFGGRNLPKSALKPASILKSLFKPSTEPTQQKKTEIFLHPNSNIPTENTTSIQIDVSPKKKIRRFLKLDLHKNKKNTSTSTNRNNESEKSVEINLNIHTNFLKISSSRKLKEIVWQIFVLSDTQELYKISRLVFDRFMNKVEHLYEHKSNPYHNFRHGITVMNILYHFIISPSVVEREFFSTLGSSSLLFAGLIHDLDHSGKNNNYEISSLSTLSIRYNDVSVLENHHVATAFDILS